MTNNKIIIKQADENDIENIAILLDKYRVFYKQISDLESATQFITERVSQKESVIFIAYEKDTNSPAGFIQLYPSFSTVSLKRQWVLNDLYVDEKYRQQGIATKLITTAQDYFKNKAKGLFLVTAKDNDKAKKLYDSLNWKTGDYDFYYFAL